MIVKRNDYETNEIETIVQIFYRSAALSLLFTTVTIGYRSVSLSFESESDDSQ